MRRFITLGFCGLLMGCTSAPQEAACDRFVTEVVSVSYGSGQSHGRDAMPDIVFGPPEGAGCCSGSLDVVSLGNGGEIVLGFDVEIVDEPGVDFVVFENAFLSAGSVFAELATVSVSEDGETWHAFECTASEAPFGDCAGHQPVELSSADLVGSELDPERAGGDGFDLGKIGVERASYVRIVDREDLDGVLNGVFDLDAVGVVNATCP